MPNKRSQGRLNVLNNVDLVPSYVQFSHQEALFEDNEAVIKMVIKGRSRTMRHVSRTHRVALDRLFDRNNLDPKIQIKYIDTKNELADMLTKGNFTRDEWNHLLSLFNISHFSSTDCSEVMSKRTQEESGEERVTGKSRPMMGLIARAPSTLSSSASESPGKRSYESQSPLSMQAEKYDRTVKPVVCRDKRHEHRHHRRFVENTHSASYSEWDADKTWSSQEWKSDELMDDRTEKPVVCPQRGAHAFQSRFSREHKHVILEEEENHERTGKPVVCPQRGAQQFVSGDDETESDLSLGSRSFLDRVNDQVRKRQKRSSMNVTEDGEKHSVIWGMFMSSTLESSVNYSDNWHSIKNTEDLTMKQMFDMSDRTIRRDLWNEYKKLGTLFMEDLSLIGDEQILNLQRTKVFVFSDSVLCLGKIHDKPQSNTAWEQRLEWFKSTPEYRTLDRIDGEPMELRWNIFPGFNTLQLSQEVQELLLSLNETPGNF